MNQLILFSEIRLNAVSHQHTFNQEYNNNELAEYSAEIDPDT